MIKLLRLLEKDLSSYNCVFDKEYIISGHIPVFNISIVLMMILMNLTITC